MLGKKIFFCKILFLSFFVFTNINSAAFITHTYFAERFLKKCTNYTNYTDEQEKDFIRGTNFPDVTIMIEKIFSREETHGRYSLDDVVEAETPFQAGFRFHSFIDNFRADFVLKCGIYEKLGLFLKEEIFEKNRYRFLCLLEDMVIESYFDTSEVYDYFEHPHKEELAMIQEKVGLMMSQIYINFWHIAVRNWIGKGNVKTNVFDRVLNVGFAGKFKDYIEALKSRKDEIKGFAKSDFMKDYVKSMTEYFDGLFKEFNNKIS